jgi:hypothetical protein
MKYCWIWMHTIFYYILKLYWRSIKLTRICFFNVIILTTFFLIFHFIKNWNNVGIKMHSLQNLAKFDENFLYILTYFYYEILLKLYWSFSIFNFVENKKFARFLSENERFLIECLVNRINLKKISLSHRIHDEHWLYT